MSDLIAAIQAELGVEPITSLRLEEGLAVSYGASPVGSGWARVDLYQTSASGPLRVSLGGIPAASFEAWTDPEAIAAFLRAVGV